MDLATAQTRLQLWLDAEAALAEARSFTIGNRQLTRASLTEVREATTYWTRVVNSLTVEAAGATGGSIRTASWTG